MLSNDWIKSWTRRATWIATLLCCFSIASTAYAATNSYVPSIVISSASTVSATGLPGDLSNVALDACGNIYAVNPSSGQVVEIPYGGGAATTVLGAASYGTASLSIDAAKANLYVLQGFTGSVYKIPISNCVAQTAAKSSIGVGDLGAISYYWGGSAVASDSNSTGDVFIATNSACCASSNELLEEVPANSKYPDGTAKSSATLLANLSSPITSIALDASNNIYYVSGGALYELAIATDGYSTTPVSFGSGYSSSVVGVTVDNAGNLYIADGGNSTIFEIPYESTTSGSALNPSDQFVVAAGVAIVSAPVISPSGAVFFANYDASSLVYSVVSFAPGTANFASVNVGHSGTGTINVSFNAATTLGSFAIFSAGKTIAATGGTCAASTAYKAGDSCTIAASFTPASPGIATGSLTLADSTGAILETGYLSGTGLGAGITLDSGTATSIGGGFSAPKSIAIDAAGNTYVADSGNSAVLEFTPGSTTAISLGVKLSKPSGVAVDGAGNVFIADTGNNQIVEVPVVNGVLKNSAQITIVAAKDSNGNATPVAGAALNAPAGVTVDAGGNLYIADTGNNRIVYLPYSGSWNLSNALALGSDLTGPLATAVDPIGNLYVADSGSGQIYRLTAPVSSGVQVLVAVGYSNPSALATDASGSLFVVDQGAGSIVRIPSVSGALDPNDALEVGFGIANPYGVAVDPAGNLYVSDSSDAAAYEIARTNVTEAFGSWAVNASSGPLPVQVENEGNQTLTLASPYYTGSGNTGDFSLNASATTACVNGGSVLSGAGCELDATFTPAATGARSETIVLASNAKNVASPQIVLSGSGATTSATTTALAITSPASGAPFFGEPIALTATVASSAGTPTGSVSLLVDGVISGSSTLAGGTATFNLATGLTGGKHTLQAVYLASGAFDGSNSSSLAIAVTTAPTTSTLVINAPFTNPDSAVQGSSVTFTVTVNSTGVGIPTGSVKFSTGSTTLSTVPLEPAAGGAFQASISTTALPVGTDAIVATYSGDANYVGSSVSGTVIVVTRAQVVLSANSTTLTSSSTSSGSVTFTQVSEGGWAGIVGYSCVASSLPANARCVFSPGQATVFPSTSAGTFEHPTVTLSITIDQPPQTPTASMLTWWLGGLTGLSLFWVRRRMMRGAWATVTMLIAMAMLAVTASGLMGCSNGAQFVTPTGNSTVTVYASADPYALNSDGSINSSATQSCGINPTTKASDPTLAPCSQQTYQVALTVK